MEHNTSSIQSIVSELEHLDLSRTTPASISKIIERLHHQQILAPKHILHPETTIIRARPVSDFNEVKYKQDISYVPIEKNTSYQRASTPHNTMYYGVIDRQEKIPNSMVSCFMECCSCFRETAQDGNYYVVIGYWKVIKELTLFSIFNPLSQINRSFSTKLFADNFKTYFNETERKISHSDAICLHNYLYRQFTNIASKESDYWVSSLISEIILSTDILDGIVYESNQSQDPKLCESLCVAIKPQSVDNKLEFIGATDYDISICDGKSTLKSIREHVFQE